MGRDLEGLSLRGDSDKRAAPLLRGISACKTVLN